MNKIKNQYLIIIIALISIIPICFLVKNKKSDDSTIKIGVLLHLTGKYAPHGLAARDGVKLYVDEINENGGINGKKIECIEYDDEGDPAKAIIGYNFLKENNVSGIVTGVITAPALAVVNEAKNDDIPIMIAIASADAITSDNGQTYKNVFRVGFTDTFQGKVMAKFAKSKGHKNASVLFCAEDDYSLGLKNSFVNECKSLGLDISAIESFSANSVDFHAQLESIKSKNPDLIFVPSYYEIVGLIVQQARDLNIKCSITGADSWIGVPKYTSNVSDLNNCYYCSPYSLDDPSKLSVEFRKNYVKKYNNEPTQCSAGGYNAVKVFIESAKKSLNENSKANSDNFRKKIINNLVDTNVDCVGGTIKFDKNHNPEKQATIIQIKDGKEQFYQKI